MLKISTLEEQKLPDKMTRVVTHLKSFVNVGLSAMYTHSLKDKCKCKTRRLVQYCTQQQQQQGLGPGK